MLSHLVLPSSPVSFYLYPFLIMPASHPHCESESSDWDLSVSMDDLANPSTPRNSILFPKDSNADPSSPPRRPPRTSSHRDSSPSKEGRPHRTLSELLKLHAEKGTTCAFTQEEASRVGDVLDQWVRHPPVSYLSSSELGTRSTRRLRHTKPTTTSCSFGGRTTSSFRPVGLKL